MRRVRIVSLFLAAACSASDKPGTPPETPGQGEQSRAATSQIVLQPDSAGLQRYETINRRFAVADLRHRDRPDTRVLLEETSDQHCCHAAEKETWGTVTVDGWVGAAEQSGSPTWHLLATADEGQLWEEFYQTVVFGCCDAKDVRAYYGLTNGHLVFTATDTLVAVDVPNTDIKRYFAFYDRYAESDPPETQDAPDLIGVLQYGPPEGPAQRVLVRVDGDPSIYYYSAVRPVIHDTVKTGPVATLWPDDGDAPPLSHFGIQITFSARTSTGDDLPDAVIRVPVVDDRLDLAHSTLPTGFRVTRVR